MLSQGERCKRSLERLRLKILECVQIHSEVVVGCDAEDGVRDTPLIDSQVAGGLGPSLKSSRMKHEVGLRAQPCL